MISVEIGSFNFQLRAVALVIHDLQALLHRLDVSPSPCARAHLGERRGLVDDTRAICGHLDAIGYKTVF